MKQQHFIETIHIQISLTDYGDALIYGNLANDSYMVSGMFIKQRLFALHEASFYGTELATKSVQDVELIVLPAEQVIPFLAEQRLLTHVEWIWEGDASRLAELAPLLADCMEQRRFKPSFAALKAGKPLQWTWDEEALGEDEQALLARLTETRYSYVEGLHAAFSAAVYERYYADETAAADLKREFPLLFGAADQAAANGLDEPSWLIAAGWKADEAPFRPLLQLLEPDETDPDWRMKVVLQDKQDPALLVPIRLAADGDAFGSWPAAWTPVVQERSAGWLDRLRACLPRERFAGSRDDCLSAPMTDAAAWQFLTADSQRLLEAGWQVLLPAWWEAASRKKPRLRAKVRAEAGASGAGQSLFGLNAIVNFDWRIAIGEADLSEAEFLELAARNERLVRFRGQWISLDPHLLAQIRRAMESMDQSEGLSFQDVLQLHLLGGQDEPASAANAASPEAQASRDERIKLEVELNAHLIGLITQLGQQSDWPPLDPPAGLRAELRTYQREGFAWLAFLRQFGLGGCLADDMGLGKTVQLIAYLLHVKETVAAQSVANVAMDSAANAESNGTAAPSGTPELAEAAAAAASSGPARMPALVICPTSVLGNWQKELSRFGPSLGVMLHYGSKRRSGEAFYEQASQADVILTSYSTATLDQELLQTYKWSAICLDEAQNIKNAQTKQSSAIRSFSADHRIALTGTPIENRLSELWSIYDFINPGYLGSSNGFQQRFANAIEKERDEQRTQDLQRLVKPFMLRRKKKDPNIQLDLPDKNEMKTYVHLTAEQGALYDQTVNALMDKMKMLEGIERKGAILSALTQLKQLCDHPMLLTKEAMPELPAPASGSAAPPAIEDNPGMSEAAEMVISRSSKLERLLAMVKELREEGDRCLIFTQYIGMGNMLQQVLQNQLQEQVLYLNGSTSKTARDRMIEQFQSQTLPADEQPNVFILSIKAGGVGLNLTAANHVFHFDRWWNPAVENQATDRAYRMGQTRDVQVHKFIALGTLEEKIDEMLESKQRLSDDVITSSEGWITELSTNELKELFTLRRDWNG
ncbi:SNF2-related protein [Paenibacillus curdlanolyticus YK9]|uniref:SNF2-related protein n=1 Tax=Paenibacillus curdlanolyticus YK9 TaxID=717606 RepID=E0IAQ1_9BACL|nr:DEAD/DEAH box helicase [Paenibacillus curdlanolyticus]EFM10455.1 SNF2-related protein [Paenibacillus curdlanolyticus YK9]